MKRDYAVTRRCLRCRERKPQTGGSYKDRRFICAACLRTDPPQQPAKPVRSPA